jgi:glutathione S-transferase
MNTAPVARLGVLSLLNFARKHAERLAKHDRPDVAALSGPVLAVSGDLESAYAASRPLAALSVAATRNKDVADDDLDDTIAQVSYELLGPSILNGDRDAKDYRVLFPEGNIRFIQGPDRAELVQVNAIATYLELNPSHPMASRAVVLRQKAAAVEAALGPATSAQSALEAALVVQRERKAALVRVLRKNVRFLRDQFDGVEAKVDALFPTFAEAKVKEDTDPTEPTA